MWGFCCFLRFGGGIIFIFSHLFPSYIQWKCLKEGQCKRSGLRGLLHQAAYIFLWEKCTQIEVYDRLPKLICAFGPAFFLLFLGILGAYGWMMTATLLQEQIMEIAMLCFTAHLPWVFKLRRINFYWFLVSLPWVIVQLSSWCSSVAGIHIYASHINMADAPELALDSM